MCHGAWHPSSAYGFLLFCSQSTLSVIQRLFIIHHEEPQPLPDTSRRGPQVEGRTWQDAASLHREPGQAHQLGRPCSSLPRTLRDQLLAGRVLGQDDSRRDPSRIYHAGRGAQEAHQGDSLRHHLHPGRKWLHHRRRGKEPARPMGGMGAQVCPHGADKILPVH